MLVATTTEHRAKIFGSLRLDTNDFSSSSGSVVRRSYAKDRLVLWRKASQVTNKLGREMQRKGIPLGRLLRLPKLSEKDGCDTHPTIYVHVGLAAVARPPKYPPRLEI